MDKKIVTSCATLRTYLSREMALMRDYALNELISPPSLVCKKNSSHLHSFRVGFLFNCTDLGKTWCKTCTKLPCWGVREGRSETRQTKSSLQTFLCLFCPSATFALQHGGFVPREWLAAKGLLHYPLDRDLSRLMDSVIHLFNSWGLLYRGSPESR